MNFGVVHKISKFLISTQMDSLDQCLTQSTLSVQHAKQKKQLQFW
jgi:hypothetical protein